MKMIQLAVFIIIVFAFFALKLPHHLLRKAYEDEEIASKRLRVGAFGFAVGCRF